MIKSIIILLLAIAVFISGCATTPSNRFVNPQQQDLQHVNKGQEIKIFTFDEQRIVMTLDSVTEHGVIGYVINTWDGSSYVEVNDGVIVTIPFENIDILLLNGVPSPKKNILVRELEDFGRVMKEGSKQGLCIVTLGLACYP